MNLITSTDAQILGQVQCPGDKSISQRVLILGAFMNQDMVIDGFLHGEDPLSTMNALNQIGAGITICSANSSTKAAHFGSWFIFI